VSHATERDEQAMRKTAAVLLTMVDANERRTYAVYIETQLAAEPKPKLDVCELVPGMRLKTVCKTRDEFDAFVAGYMEE
jgi:hypothetical protein